MLYVRSVTPLLFLWHENSQFLSALVLYFHFPACKSETSKVICLVFLWNMCVVFAVFMSSFSGGVYSSSHAEVWSCLLFLVETQDSGVCSVWGGSPSSHSSSHPSSHCFQLHVETCRNHSTELTLAKLLTWNCSRVSRISSTRFN